MKCAVTVKSVTHLVETGCADLLVEGIVNLEKERDALKAEVERLRKAGDAVRLCLEAYLYCTPYDGPMTIQCLDAWLAAKEGKQP